MTSQLVSGDWVSKPSASRRSPTSFSLYVCLFMTPFIPVREPVTAENGAHLLLKLSGITIYDAYRCNRTSPKRPAWPLSQNWLRSHYLLLPCSRATETKWMSSFCCHSAALDLQQILEPLCLREIVSHP